jgi:hypothetical protein
MLATDWGLPFYCAVIEAARQGKKAGSRKKGIRSRKRE